MWPPGERHHVGGMDLVGCASRLSLLLIASECHQTKREIPGKNTDPRKGRDNFLGKM